MTGLKDPCPCGSGKRYKHCHRNVDNRRQKRTSWVVLAALFVVALVGVVLLLRGRTSNAPVAATGGTGNAAARTTGTTFPMTTTTPATGQASNNQAPLADGRAPQPYEFDATANRHWDPAHGHWHDGPPPPASLRGTGTSTSATTASGAPVQVNTTTSQQISQATSVDQSPLPDGSAPQPYQYDAPKNRYWDPGHNHWHVGQPPAPGSRTATSTTVTTTPATQSAPPATGGR